MSFMTDISKRGPDCDNDCEGERGKRGRRGHRGHDGSDGSAGSDGATGPTGSTGTPGSSGPLARQIFTADGIYVPTPGTTKVHVMMSGGGGAGTGSQGSPAGVSVGGGGASGAALDFFIDGGGPISGGPVVIGPGGISAIAGGSAGGPTSVTINTVVYTAAPGSQGGFALRALVTSATISGGTQLPGSSAVDVVSGDNGLPGIVTDLTTGHGGSGAGGAFGIGGRGSLGPGVGLIGSGYGAGGGGAFSTDTSFIGGDGTAGVVIIDEFA